MAIDRYSKDYRLVDSVDGRGRIRSETEYIGEYFVFASGLEAAHKAGKRLALLPDHAVIVNVGRGSVIDQEALERELRKGRLYAGLDVFETEPVPADSSLWSCLRLIITPHVAGDPTLPHTVDRIVDLVLEDFDNYCAGRPLIRIADRGMGY